MMTRCSWKSIALVQVNSNKSYQERLQQLYFNKVMFMVGKHEVITDIPGCAEPVLTRSETMARLCPVSVSVQLQQLCRCTTWNGCTPSGWRQWHCPGRFADKQPRLPASEERHVTLKVTLHTIFTSPDKNNTDMKKMTLRHYGKCR